MFYYSENVGLNPMDRSALGSTLRRGPLPSLRSDAFLTPASGVFWKILTLHLPECPRLRLTGGEETPGWRRGGVGETPATKKMARKVPVRGPRGGRGGGGDGGGGRSYVQEHRYR